MIQFQPYGLLIGLGIVVGVEIAERARLFLAEKQKKYRQFSAWTGAWWVILPALIGARLYHVIDFWGYYAQFPQKILATWEGGMGIWGGLMGGLVGLLAYSFVVTKKSSSKRIFNFQFSIFKLFLSMADVAVVGLPLGQAIGRLGNFFNQELYGLPTQLPWGLYIWPENRLAGYDSLERFHPLFAYEAVWNLLTFVIVITMIGKTRRTFVQPGLLFFVYLFLYGLGRFFLEFLRLNPWRLGMLTVAQWLGIISMGASLIFFGRIMRKDR